MRPVITPFIMPPPLNIGWNQSFISVFSRQDQEEEKQRWRRELAQSQEQVRAIATSGSDSHSFRWVTTGFPLPVQLTCDMIGPDPTASSAWSLTSPVSRTGASTSRWWRWVRGELLRDQGCNVILPVPGCGWAQQLHSHEGLHPNQWRLW